MDYKIITIEGFRYLLDLNMEITDGVWYATKDEVPDSVYNISNKTKDIDNSYSTYVIIASDNPELELPYIKVATKNDIINNTLIHLGHHIEADEMRYYRSDKEEGNVLYQLSKVIERAMDDYTGMTAPAGGYSYEDLRYHCTRFAHYCRLYGVNTNDSTVNLFDKEYAPLLTQPLEEQYVNIKTRTVLSKGWVPTYNNPDNHNFDPSAEPIDIPYIDGDKDGKPFITVKLIKN